MNIRTKIIVGFSIIIILLSAMGSYLLRGMQGLSRETENIYKHPFTVSNAARDITIHLLAVQNHLKDIIMARQGADISGYTEKISFRVRLIHKGFELIGQRFLGDKAAVDRASQAFVAWEKVFNRVLYLCETGEKERARAILESEFPGHREAVDEAVGFIMDFASGKATEFYTQTLDSKRYSLVVLSVMLMVTITGSIFILIYVVRNHDAALREIHRYFHLIDQNILTASTNPKGQITDISNAMCRFLECGKKDILGKACDFFINGGDQEALADRISRTIHTGKHWEGDIRRINRAGETQWIHLSIHPVFDDKFKIRSFTHIVEDVTDRKILQELSITDNLTGLHNRRFFEEVMEKQIRLARRNGGFLTLAILDIDFFKPYNDNYGHPAGDEVLADLAGVLKQIMNRPDDYVFRLGGEEFGLLFSDTDRQNSRLFLERIRQEVEALGIEHGYSGVAHVVTVSMGARVYKGMDIPHKNQFYSQADQALYDAKKQRNKVVVV